jgi:hypothetical protein
VVDSRKNFVIPNAEEPAYISTFEKINFLKI